jgi:hypothetical protein
MHEKEKLSAEEPTRRSQPLKSDPVELMNYSFSETENARHRRIGFPLKLHWYFQKKINKIQITFSYMLYNTTN